MQTDSKGFAQRHATPLSRSPGQLRVGTSGWNYPHWRGVFYPADLPAQQWFAHYRQFFDTVEINNTFYQLPALSTFARWQQQAPLGFCFAVKANRYITHVRRLRQPEQTLTAFLERVRQLGNHLGPILYQLPPRWRPNLERLRTFLRELPDDLLQVIEFRDAAWLSEAVLAALAEKGIGLCIHDHIANHPRVLTGPAAYVRFHGASAPAAGNYSADQLRAWAAWMRQTAHGGHDVYAYFNNDWQAHALRNAHTLRHYLKLKNPNPINSKE